MSSLQYGWSKKCGGKLFEDYLEIVNQIKPKFFVMENVKELLSMEHDKETLTKNEKRT